MENVRKRYFINLASFIQPHRNAVNVGIFSLVATLQEAGSTVHYVYLGSESDAQTMREFMADFKNPAVVARFSGCRIFYLHSLTEFPPTELATAPDHFDYYIALEEDKIEYEPLLSRMNGTCLIAENSPGGMVRVAEDLGLTCGAFDNDHRIKRIPCGTFAEEVAVARATQ